MPYGNPTYTAVQAILKTKYPDGAIPQALYKDFPLLALVKKTTNFDGDFKVVALQNERPQGSSSVFSAAQTVASNGPTGGGGSYNKFNVYRTRHYGILRMDGELMKAAVRTSGALVDLWNNETDGISKNELADLEFQLFGDGTGTRGTVSTYTASGGTIAATDRRVSLTTPSDAVYFNLGMRLRFTDSAGVEQSESNASSNGLYVTKIDRKAGTIDFTCWTTSAQLPTWTGTGASLTPANGFLIARFGDNQLASAVGVASGGQGMGVLTGIQAWIPSTVTATTFWGLDRTSDPVRLAGQRLSATGLPMNEALMEGEAQVAIQGVGYPDTIIVNPLDLQNLKKALGTDITYDRVQSNIAGVSFKAIEYDGMNGPMKIVSDAFCPRNRAFMLQLSSWELSTLGPAPQLLDWDNNDFLRVAGADQYEVRFGHYGQFICNNPGANIIITNFGL